MTNATDRIILVNNTGADIRMFDAELTAHVNEGVELPEEIADIFNVTILENHNHDGSNRGIVDWA